MKEWEKLLRKGIKSFIKSDCYSDLHYSQKIAPILDLECYVNPKILEPFWWILGYKCILICILDKGQIDFLFFFYFQL
jgi:hypothetical protein